MCRIQETKLTNLVIRKRRRGWLSSVKACTQLTLAFFSLKEDEDLMTDNLKDETMFLKSLRDWHLNLEALR